MPLVMWSLLRVQEFEELIKSMSIELEQVKGQLMVAERQADPSPQILKLRQEMASLKVKCVMRSDQGTSADVWACVWVCG